MVKLHKLGILSDAHGNPHALQVALDALKARGCDEIIFLGDAVAIGPQSKACLERLLKSGVTQLLGNHDTYYLNAQVPGLWPFMGESEAAHQHWTHSVLGAGYREALAACPYQVTRQLGPLTLALMHYPRQGEAWAPIPREPDAQSLDALFEGVAADVVVFGHDHRPLDVKGKRRYLDPGALGCSGGGQSRAMVLTWEQEGLQVQHLMLPYGHQDLLAAFETLQVPGREEILSLFYADLS